MRTACRCGCGYFIPLVCLASLIFAAPALGLSANFTVAANGSLYEAMVDLESVDRYSFYETGMLGERIPVQVTDVTLWQGNKTVPYNRTEVSTITFPKDSYMLTFAGPIHDNHLQQVFPKPYNVTVRLPQGLHVTNPLIGMISPLGGRVSIDEGNVTTLSWDQIRSFEIRFYDKDRETLLYLFGGFWVVVTGVFFMLFLLTWKGRRI